MRKIGYGCFVVCGLALGACSKDMPACDNGSAACAFLPDLSGTQAQDLTMADLASGPDIAGPTVDVNWNLLTANIQGGTNNSFQIDCDDPMANVTQLQISAVDQTNSAFKVTTIACPGGTATGTTTISLPDATGPFTISGTAVGKAMSASEKIKDVPFPSGPVTLRIYVGGCDMPACQ